MMSNSVVLFLVVLFSLVNFGTGLTLAAFFGKGPWRTSRAVRFVSDPRIPPPGLPRVRLPRFAARHRSEPTTAG
ncbi:MAG: hypothetical protein FJ297_00055 [Planctomycetes bacterium]|nr:hypothetical protein [Planctomycetota bacterium]